MWVVQKDESGLISSRIWSAAFLGIFFLGGGGKGVPGGIRFCAKFYWLLHFEGLFLEGSEGRGDGEKGGWGGKLWY